MVGVKEIYNMLNQFEYYYGIEAEQFTFYRVPKILFKDQKFKKLSSDAKLLYGLMLDRMSLSIKNGWLDEQGRVYIYYTVESIMEDLGCAREKCSKVVAELDSRKGIGLIEKKRQGLGKPDKIYVKNFLSSEDFRKEDEDEYEDVTQEIRKSNLQRSEKRISGNSIDKFTESGKTNGNNTEDNNTESSNKSNHIRSSREEGMDKINTCKRLIKENISYEDLLKVYPEEEEMLNGIYDLILEIMLCEKKRIIIGRAEKPIEFVKEQFMKLRYKHIVYVMSCMRENTSSIDNIKQYMLATLFNAPSTISSYYQAKVNSDMPQLV